MRKVRAIPKKPIIDISSRADTVVIRPKIVRADGTVVTIPMTVKPSDTVRVVPTAKKTIRSDNPRSIPKSLKKSEAGS